MFLYANGQKVELFVVSSIRVLRNGIPTSEPQNEVEPLFIKVNSNIYSFKKVHYATMEKVENYNDVTSNYQLSSEIPLIRLGTNVDAVMAEQLIEEVTAKVESKLTAPPFQSQIDTKKRGFLILYRNKQKSSLLNGKYEMSSYTVDIRGNRYFDNITKKSYDGIDLFIHLNVLASNHPSNSFYDPTPKEMENYSAAINKVREDLIKELCNHYKCQTKNNQVTISPK